MPLYEYQCKTCRSLIEKIQKFSDPPLTECPHCGGELEQLISAPAVQFKGTGWYVTDYAKGSSKSGSNSGNGAASSDSGSNTGDSKSKSANNAEKSGGSSTSSSGSGSDSKGDKK